MGVNDRRPLFCSRGAPTVLKDEAASGQIEDMMGNMQLVRDVEAGGTEAAVMTSGEMACCTDGTVASVVTEGVLGMSSAEEGAWRSAWINLDLIHHSRCVILNVAEVLQMLRTSCRSMQNRLPSSCIQTAVGMQQPMPLVVHAHMRQQRGDHSVKKTAFWHDRTVHSRLDKLPT